MGAIGLFKTVLMVYCQESFLQTKLMGLFFFVEILKHQHFSTSFFLRLGKYHRWWKLAYSMNVMAAAKSDDQ